MERRTVKKTAPATSSPTRPRLFERLQAGLNEGIAFMRGEVDLKVTEVVLPDPPPVYDAVRVRALRQRLGMSQPHFSRLLNVSPKTVQSWEQGVRVPGQSAARLLQVIEDPDILGAIHQH